MDIKDVISELESPENELLIQVENDDQKLQHVASLLVGAATLLKQAQDIAGSDFFMEAFEDLASISASFEQDGDEDMLKRASVLDELLMTIAADPHALDRAKQASAQKYMELREKFRLNRKEISVTDQLKKINRTDKAEKRIKESKVVEAPKAVSPMQYAREARTCPEHAGALVRRVSDGVWQCTMDQKIFDFNTGFSVASGEKVPGGSVANQNQYTTFEIPAWDKPTKI
jgi:ribosomal protein L37AE/L43A